MASKKPRNTKPKEDPMAKAYIEGAGSVLSQPITETLETNYMPYAMSVIVSRAFPEIDGFKPSHRKLLYTMYKMGLLTGAKTKSANIVGQTMKLNPHGDGPIYETMVRLAKGNEALLHPYVDSKGNFGKAYSRDMSYAASRYTEAKLASICNELFRDIDKDTVDFVPNYDNTMLEPTLFPTSYPAILINSNVGIGVSMASTVCPFNLNEICETTIALIREDEHNALGTLNGPDFPGGGFLIYDEAELDKVYKTGRGSLKIRAKYQYDKEANCLEILEIPPTTTVEAIIEKIISLIKIGKIREISYLRDETDKNGLKIAIDLKRGTDPEKLMQKLFRMTPLQDNFSCNFNILVHGYPKVMGIYDILREWISFRMECIRRRYQFDLKKKSEKLHILKGMKIILLDIDKAVKVVRDTENEADVVPNLMIEFGIDGIQAEYVAEIKLRHLNREYILKRIEEIEQLEKDIEMMKEIIASERKQKLIIIDELKEVSKKYGQPRKTLKIFLDEGDTEEIEEDIPDYTVKIFMSKSGYFKKITPQSLRMSGQQKLKDGDAMLYEVETTNKAELLFFTDKASVYKAKASQFADTKASVLGSYIPAELSFDEQDAAVAKMIITKDYSGHILFVYENGKVAKVPLNAYETKTNRKKLTNAYSAKSRLVEIIHITEDCEVMLHTSNGRAMIFNTAMLLPKLSRDTIGVSVMTLKAKGAVVDSAVIISQDRLEELAKFKTKTIPVAGSFAKDMENPDQLSLI